MMKFIFGIWFIALCSFFSLEGAEHGSSILIVNMKDEAALPRNFRTSEDKLKKCKEASPSEEGLKTLRMSGSAQFSEKSLRTMICRLGNPKNFFIVDLRQESHGFLNGAAVSWYGKRNRDNVGKSILQIQTEEKLLLKGALIRKDIVLSKVSQKDSEGIHLPDVISMPFVVYEMGTEEEVAERINLKYIRIPVTDCCKPTSEMVDRFIDFVKSLPEDSWIHFHCSAGVGRTTTFMAMYDMMKNAKNVSFEDIIKRQNLLGGKGLNDFGPTDNWKYPYYAERYSFLKEFYKFCRR